MRILIVEDEPALRRQIADRLRREGFVVDEAADGREGLFAGREYPVDVAIVDIGLPKLSGLELVRRLRTDGKAYPILILTARGRWQEKVEGLEAGADDYVVKPFHMQELLARIQVLLRRAGGWADPVLRCGPIALDTRSGQVERCEAPLDLTAFEYRLLEYLMHHADQVVSKSELTEHLYPDDADRDSNVIEVFIRRLRRKLDPDGTLHPIETLRGRGYRLTAGNGG